MGTETVISTITSIIKSTITTTTASTLTIIVGDSSFTFTQSIIQIAITAIIFLIIGFILVIKKPFKFAFIIGIVFVGASSFVFLQAMIKDLSDVFMVWGTLTLALFAATTLNENARLHKDTLDKEQRDRIEKRLIEIADWANKLQLILLSYENEPAIEAKNISIRVNSLNLEKLGLIESAKKIDTKLSDIMMFKNNSDDPEDNTDLIDSFLLDLKKVSGSNIFPSLVSDFTIGYTCKELQIPPPEDLKRSIYMIIAEVSLQRADIIKPLL